MKKKIVAMCATVAIAALAVGGTLAFFTDEEKATNTFTIGDVDITLTEPAWKADENEANKLIPGRTIDKDPTVTVKANSEDCYVRAFVTVSDLAALDAIFAPEGADLKSIFAGYNEKWEYAGETEANDAITYEFRYNAVVAKNAADQKLDPIFTDVVVPSWITDEQLATLTDGLTIDIVAQAIQAEGFEGDAAKAWDAFKVQNA